MSQTYQQFLKSLPKQEAKQHKKEWACKVPHCRDCSSWWLCITCGENTCRSHQAFNGWIVRFCAICCPQEFGLVNGYIPKLMISKRQKFNEYATNEKGRQP